MAQEPEKNSVPRASRKLRVLAAVVAVAGLSVSLTAWQWRHGIERSELTRAFVAESDNLRALAEREVANFLSVLDSIRHLHTISERISDEDFREFVDKGMQHQRAILGAFGFAQVVAADRRAAYENSSSAPSSRVVRIVERDRSGGLAPAGPRAQYFPLTYESPDGGLGIPRGFDLGSAPAEQSAIVRMMQGGGIALGGRGWGPESNAYLALAPILYVAAPQPGQPPAGFLMGFASALLRPAALLEPALRAAATRGVGIRLIDAPPAGAPGPDSGDQALRVSRSEASRDAPLVIADQIWTFHTEAQHGFIARHRTSQPRILLSAGLVVTGLLCWQLLLLARRAETIERVVRERTADLRESHRQLEEEMAGRRRLEQEVLDISTQEKHRVGRDLHDSLGQKLTGASYLSRALAEELSGSNVLQKETAERVNEILKEAVAQSRRIARGLSPVELSEGGLAEALVHLAKETSQVFGIRCTFHGEGAPHIAPGATATNLYQIAQEAVNNAVKHGGASEITILLENESAVGELVVEDNGKGLPAETPKRGGMGLRIMRYRANVIGGEFKLERSREGGTVVICRFPL